MYRVEVNGPLPGRTLACTKAVRRATWAGSDGDVGADVFSGRDEVCDGILGL